jgi:hypothetical protein
MTKRILQILDNVRYWDTCPDDYKKEIEEFLDADDSNKRHIVLSGEQVNELVLMVEEGIKNFESVAKRTDRPIWNEKVESLRDIKSALQGK